MQVRYAFVLMENDALQKLRDSVEENLIHKILKGSSGETTGKVDEDRPNKKEAHQMAAQHLFLQGMRSQTCEVILPWLM